MASLSYRIWPIIAAVLALLFISWDLVLVSKARKIQGRIGHQLELLGELSSLGASYEQLGLVHRVDVNTGAHRWSKELADLNDKVALISKRFEGEAGISDLPGELTRLSRACDSLHTEVIDRSDSPNDAGMPEGVFQIMLQRCKRSLERAERNIHQNGLGTSTSDLSSRWDEAQSLMVMACLVAVIFALLVGMNRRLLVESRLRSQQLGATKKNLEQTNRELRETMLSKEEKEVMIKEIHHRVKNNLQIVKSLIRFQQDQVSDDRTRELFNECITRVSAMALVHEQTYLSKDLANIDVSSYLDHLVRDLIHAYTVNTKLNMDIDIQVKTLGVDTLVPLGLLLNEVISNSFKYAFVGRDSGTITVHMNGSENNGLHVLIADDGVGLKSREGFHRPNSLGMDLIHTLAGQLDASIVLLDGPGTRYELVSDKLTKRKVA